MTVDLLTLTLRFVHVVAGAVWVGMAVFAALFLTPAVQELGPAGGRVMATLQRRGLMTVLPLLALGTLLSGIWLYWRASLGLQAAYLSSRVGLAFALGGVVALVAYGLGIAVVRPAMLRATTLAQALEGLPEPTRDANMAEIRGLRGRSARAGQVVALLLLLAAGLMAVARYL